MFCGGFLVCLFTLYHNTVIKARNFFALKLKFFLEKFWCFGKKSYLCIRFQEVTC